MSITLLDLKTRVREDVWSAGEPRSRRAAHDRYIVDALIEIQKYVECWQQNNTDLVPHCATHYNCGLTSFDFYRARIKRLSVIDNENEADASPAAVLGDSASSDYAGVFAKTSGGASIVATEITDALVNSNTWEFFNLTTPAYAEFRFSTAVVATKFTLVFRAARAQELTFTIVASNDGASWTQIDQQDAPDWTVDEALDVSFTNTTEYLLYRIQITPTTITHPLFNLTFGPFTISGGTATAATGRDWCSEIVYEQVDACVLRQYIAGSQRCGCCLPLDLYLAIPASCLGGKGVAPVPTDEGLPTGLAPLPLGYHYPQTSTDATSRATRGYWAVERGRVLVAPWIQSTETIILRWDGIKREWTDGDRIDDDPDLIRAVKMWVQKEIARDENKDIEEMRVYEREFNLALQDLAHECREETRARECEPSHARGVSGDSTLPLYYNDAQPYTARCPSGTTGASQTYTVPADTVGSAKSKEDANELAYEEAKRQAEALLVCESVTNTYWNRQVDVSVSCKAFDDNPLPEGQTVSITIPRGGPNSGGYSSEKSEDDATDKAKIAAYDLAYAQLECTYYNARKEATASCPEGQEGPDVDGVAEAKSIWRTITNATPEYSQSVQDALNNEAEAKALSNATEDLVCGGEPVGSYSNDTMKFCRKTFVMTCRGLMQPVQRSFVVNYMVPVGRGPVASTVAEANSTAQLIANSQCEIEGSQIANSFVNRTCPTQNTWNICYGGPCP